MSGDAVDVVDADVEGADEPIAFSPLADGNGVRIVDTVERRSYSVLTPSAVAVERVADPRLPVPVDAAVRLTTASVTLPFQESVYVRDASGDPVAHTFGADRSCPAGRYLIDVTTAVKLFLSVEAPVAVTHDADSTTIDFGEPTAVVVGAASPGRRPIGSLRVSADLDELRAAVSAFGSALKTTSPERSFPYHRAHPPLVELGEAASIPAYLAPPDTGVTVEVGRSVEDLLVASPLSFYLGATVEWGDRRLVTDDGFSHDLADATSFETGVERALQQTFLLDCLTRTEGVYPVDLEERRRFEARLPGALDFEALYDAPIAARLEAYLGVGYDAVADLLPRWTARAHVEPSAESVAALPFLLDSLATVRAGGERPLDGGAEPADPPASRPFADVRSTQATARPAARDGHLVLPEPDGAHEAVWVGDGIPVGATKAVPAGFRHRLEREPTEADIRIQVVCAERSMDDELASVDGIYRGRRDPRFDVDVAVGVTTAELRDRIERDADLLHYIGHIDDRGFECRDGWLDAADCASVGADTFLLNSCRSFAQGEALVRRGAIAAIATVTDLLNHRAAAIGRTLARFLNAGFPLYAALEVVRDAHRFGGAYTVIGDANVVLAQPTTTFPEYLEVVSSGDDRVRVAHRTFPSSAVGLGTIVCPPYVDDDRHFLFGGEVATPELARGELADLLALPMPLRDGDELRFSLAEDATGG